MKEATNLGMLDLQIHQIIQILLESSHTTLLEVLQLTLRQAADVIEFLAHLRLIGFSLLNAGILATGALETLVSSLIISQTAQTTIEKIL
jgi:predicted methyltransferase